MTSVWHNEPFIKCRSNLSMVVTLFGKTMIHLNG